MFLSEFLLLFVILLLLWYYIGTFNHGYFKDTDVKFLKPLPYLGNYGPVFLFGKHVIEVVQRLHETFKSERYVGFLHFFVPWIWIMDNELIKQIGVKDYESFIDHTHPVVDHLDPLYANMLAGFRGKKWKEMRARMTPAFTSVKIKAMFPLIRECASQLVDHVKREMSEKGSEEIEKDVKDIFGKSATDVIASTAFGFRLNSLEDKNNKFLRMAMQFTEQTSRFMLIYTLNTLFPKASEFLRLKLMDRESENYFRDAIINSMKEREEKGIKRFDMIDLLIDAKKRFLKDENINETQYSDEVLTEDKKIWTDDELAGQALIFFIAGYESISNTLSLTCYVLSQHPSIQQKLIEEIDAESETKDEINMYEKIMNMKYLDMVISEILRMYPSAPVIDRVCTKPYILPPPNDQSKKCFKMNIGDVVIIHLRSLMRNPHYFPDPDKFDPERFSEENRHNILPYTYLPFGVGPRQCIGKRLAMMELKTIIFYFLSNFEVFSTQNTRDPLKTPKNLGIYTPKGEILIGLKKRKK